MAALHPAIIAFVLLVICCLQTDAWTCSSGYKNCDYNWKNGCETAVKSDVKNCGNCGVKCPSHPYSTPTCSAGKCGFTCSRGHKNCDYKTQNGCETDVGKDVKNCGNCGLKCPQYPYSIAKCLGGKCSTVCNAGWKDCNYNLKKDGCETDVGKDVKNCGNCGVKCPQYPYSIAKCNNCKCESICKAGWKDCNYNLKKDGCETDVRNDIKNCGGCGVKCYLYPNSTPTCCGGQCGFTCYKGWMDCDYNKENGCETNVENNVNNCGACGTKCPPPTYPYAEATCSNGVCGYQCISGYTYSSNTTSCVGSI